jgi:hypothetical protein
MNSQMNPKVQEISQEINDVLREVAA